MHAHVHVHVLCTHICMHAHAPPVRPLHCLHCTACTALPALHCTACTALHCLHCTACTALRVACICRWNWGEASIEATTLTFRVGGMRMSRA